LLSAKTPGSPAKKMAPFRVPESPWYGLLDVGGKRKAGIISTWLRGDESIAVMDVNAASENGAQWYESNLFWGPLSLAIAAILTVVAAMKCDSRWLLWIAWPCFSLTIWWLARRTKEVLIVTVLGTLMVGFGLLWLGNWLRPQTPHSSELAESSQPPKDHPQPGTIEPEEHPIHIKKPHVATQQTKPAPTQTQTCIGSACVQGGTGSATFNQYGAPRLEMTADQETAIRNTMKSFAGIDVALMCEAPPSDDSWEFAGKLGKTLGSAGLVVDGPRTGITNNAPVYAGVSYWAGPDRVRAATALNHTLFLEHISKSDTPNIYTEGLPNGQFLILISPNR
jgi:hypothetical protein